MATRHLEGPIIIVDDDPLALDTMRLCLWEKYPVQCFEESHPAEAFMDANGASLIILDMKLPGQDGISLLKRWKHRFPAVEIVFCSGQSSITKALECLREGASDYLEKPFQCEQLLLMVSRSLEKADLRCQVEKLSPLICPQSVDCIGSSESLSKVLAKVHLLKKQQQLNVLLLGESGTGKEVVARLIHGQEEDKKRPFVVVNTPAIPINLMESELFGVERGAFTDAKVSRAGRFELAAGGDIFLDEIGDLPHQVQAKLLRALQEHRIERVGSTRGKLFDFRVISATNRNLGNLIQEGRFREDLLYRLNDVVISLPTLRERAPDIPELARHFVAKYSRVSPPPPLSDAVLQTLISYHWPGNIRQLESTIKRSLVFNTGKTINQIEIYELFPITPGGKELPQDTASNLQFYQQMERYERKILEEALMENANDRNAAMESLGLSRATFYRKLSNHRIRIE